MASGRVPNTVRIRLFTRKYLFEKYNVRTPELDNHQMTEDHRYIKTGQQVCFKHTNFNYEPAQQFQRSIKSLNVNLFTRLITDSRSY